jgi:hypothetical protein
MLPYLFRRRKHASKSHGEAEGVLMGAIYYLLAVCLIKEAGECHYMHGGFFATYEQCVAAAEKRQLTDFKCVQMKREQPK